jgi:hypothetical protein
MLETVAALSQPALLNCILSDGQQLVPAGYSKLPAPLATNIKARVSSLK